MTRHGMTHIPLRGHPGGIQAHKLLIPPRPGVEPDPKTHEGFEWLYVISGRLRLLLGDQDLVLKPGARPPSSTPAFRTGSAPTETETVELLILFGKQGERVHVRARTATGQKRALPPR